MTSADRVRRAHEIVNKAGGYAAAVDAVMEISRHLWDLALAEDAVMLDTKLHFLHYYRIIDENRIVASLRHRGDGVADLLLEQIRECELSRAREQGKAAFQRVAFQPVALAREILRGVRPDHELRYFAMLSTRQRYECALTSGIAHAFQALTNALNSMISSWHTSNRAVLDYGEPQPSWPYKSNFVDALSKVVEGNGRIAESRELLLGAFIECCRVVNYLQLGAKPGWVSVRSKEIDAAFLISHLFGMPTGIPGFDDLFGGGGIMLSESLESSRRTRIKGRSILTVGRFGTGKSLLSLQIAAEVARKGGIVWVIAFEQTAEECLFALESVCGLPDDGTVAVARTNEEAAQLLTSRKEGRGAIIFLRPSGDGLGEFVDDFSATIRSMLKYESYPLRLAIVDPMNAIVREAPVGKLRSQTFRMLEEAKTGGVNIWLIAEDAATAQSGEVVYEQNIADTVINLFVEERSGYSQRYFQITKSRFQREQRGKHPFSIVPGQGISIFPSAAAVSARIRPRTIRAPITPTQFGLPSLDTILGPGAIHAGDVIVLQGPSGCFKTPVGLYFLFGADERKGGFAANRRTASLLIAARDNLATITDTLKRHQTYHAAPSRTKAQDLRVTPAGSVYVKPGQILQQIEKELVEARLQRCSIDRVLIDNIEHWELSCPFLQAEPTFGNILIDLLRRNHVSSLLICEDLPPGSGSVLERSVVAHADCIIQFIRVEFHGRYHVMIRVLKTRSMKHRREFFELRVRDGGVDVDTSSSLLRITPSGDVAPVKIRLILHSQSQLQDEYNRRLLDTVRSILSRDVEIDSLSGYYLTQALSLGFPSGVDELQLLELGEFQLTNPEGSNRRGLPLHKFSMSRWDEMEWRAFLPQLKRQVSRGGGFIAVPYYEDVSLLAFRHEHLKNTNAMESWVTLAEECLAWEGEHTGEPAMFFDFPGDSDESFNCLFIEILLSLSALPDELATFRLLDWIQSPRARQAGKLMRTLCRRAHLAHLAQEISRRASGTGGFRAAIRTDAVLWRHWYSTLNQMMFNMPPEARPGIRVCPLPGNISVANERYLAIPAYSAAPDVGLKIISLFTSRSAESDRLRLGVGLPARLSFYRQASARVPSQMTVSPYFSLDLTALADLVDNRTFRRSTLRCYADYSGILSSHLRRLIEIPEFSEAQVEKEVESIFQSLSERMRVAGAEDQI